MGGYTLYRRLVVLSGLVLVAGAFAPGPAGAAAGTVTATPAVVPAGGTVSVSGSVAVADCPASDGVILISSPALFAPDGIGPTVARDSSGAFSTALTVPASASPGSYSIGLRCGGGNVGVAASLQVTAQVSQLPSGAPQAGLGGASRGDSLPAGWLAAGIAFVSLAAVMGLVAWRRRSTDG